MKKIIFGIFFVAISVVAFTSCEKTCTCTITQTNEVLDPSFFDYDQGDIAMYERPSTATTTGKYKGKCSDQNSTVTQTNAVAKQTTVIECR